MKKKVNLLYEAFSCITYPEIPYILSLSSGIQLVVAWAIGKSSRLGSKVSKVGVLHSASKIRELGKIMSLVHSSKNVL